jgi:hypothetical protein
MNGIINAKYCKYEKLNIYVSIIINKDWTPSNGSSYNDSIVKIKSEIKKKVDPRASNSPFNDILFIR